MVELGTAVKAFAILVTAVFSGVVLAGGPRNAANQFLAAFLLLISGNQAAELMRSLAVDPAAQAHWFHVAAVFAALDPFFLYYFVSVHPERNRLNDGWKVALVLAGGAALAFAAPLRSVIAIGNAVGTGLNMAWAAYTAVVYGVVLAHVGRHLLSAQSAAPARPFYAAVAVVALPALPRAVLPVDLAGGPLLKLALMYAPVAAALAVAWWASRRAPGASPRDRRLVVRGAAAGALLSVAIYLGYSHMLLKQAGLHQAQALSWAGGTRATALAARWVLFSVLVSMALLRHPLLGLTMRARRRAARLVVALGFLGAGGGAILLLERAVGREATGLSPVELGVLGAVLVASQAFQRLVGRVAAAVYGVPAAGDAWAALDAYRRGVDQAAREGRELEGDPALERLRREVGIDPASAEVVRRWHRSGRGPLAPGALLRGRYRVVRALGAGGAGRAFLAQDELLHRSVALKEVPCPDAAAQQRALEEARLLARVGHPNVLTVHDALARPGAVVLVTEFAEEGSLAERVEARGRLPLPEGVAVLRDVLAGLGAVHRRGVVHRDLKPANVLLTDGGGAKLADFGIALARPSGDTTLPASDAFAGTPAYMAPEQHHGGLATAACDVYAAGVLMRRCLPRDLPAPLARVADRATAVDPLERWGSAEAMLAALEEAAARAPRLR